MWVINIQHWLDDELMGPGAPQLRFKVSHLTRIISYATALHKGLPVKFQPACWRRPNRKPCPGRPKVTLALGAEEIHWLCPECLDEGVVTGWKGLIWDLSDSPATPPH